MRGLVLTGICLNQASGNAMCVMRRDAGAPGASATGAEMVVALVSRLVPWVVFLQREPLWSFLLTGCIRDTPGNART